MFIRGLKVFFSCVLCRGMVIRSIWEGGADNCWGKLKGFDTILNKYLKCCVTLSGLADSVKLIVALSIRIFL